jgi:hypothetical protein
MTFIPGDSTWRLPQDDLSMHNWKDYLHHWGEIMNKIEMSATTGNKEAKENDVVRDRKSGPVVGSLCHIGVPGRKRLIARRSQTRCRFSRSGPEYCRSFDGICEEGRISTHGPEGAADL